MPDKTKKATVTKKTAPKKFKYEKLPYKDSPKLKPMEQKDITFQSPNTMQGTPFKLGSNRGNTSYSGFQAKGLINPPTDPPSLKEQAQADADKNLEKAEYKKDESYSDPNDPSKERFVAKATGTAQGKTYEEAGVDPAAGKAYWDANPDKYKEYLASKTATASKEKFTSTPKPTTPPTGGSTPPPKTPPAPGEGKFEGFVEKPKVGITQSRKSSDKDISKVKRKDKIKNPTPKAKILNGKGGFQNPMNRMKGTFSNLRGKQKLK